MSPIGNQLAPEPTRYVVAMGNYVLGITSGELCRWKGDVACAYHHLNTFSFVNVQIVNVVEEGHQEKCRVL